MKPSNQAIEEGKRIFSSERARLSSIGRGDQFDAADCVEQIQQVVLNIDIVPWIESIISGPDTPSPKTDWDD